MNLLADGTRVVCMGWWSGFSERGSQDLPMAQMLPLNFPTILLSLHIYSPSYTRSGIQADYDILVSRHHWCRVLTYLNSHFLHLDRTILLVPPAGWSALAAFPGNKAGISAAPVVAVSASMFTGDEVGGAGPARSEAEWEDAPYSIGQVWYHSEKVLEANQLLILLHLTINRFWSLFDHEALESAAYAFQHTALIFLWINRQTWKFETIHT